MQEDAIPSYAMDDGKRNVRFFHMAKDVPTDS